MSMVRKYRGGSQYLGTLTRTSLSSDTSLPTPIWAVGEGSSMEFNRAGEIVDTRRAGGTMGGHVVHGQEDTLVFSFAVLAADDTERDQHGFGQEIFGSSNNIVQPGDTITIAAQAGIPDHYRGQWMITEVSDSFSNSEVSEFVVNLRKAAGVDYSIT